MVVYDWNMRFTFVLAGWEGTAHDAHIFYQALTNANLNFPHSSPGMYYLVDADFPTPMEYLGPYRCERCHLPDFRRSNGFDNHNEVFNYYHSSLRCGIERTFNLWKNRFAILRHMPKFSIKTQVKIVVATMVIRNFIRRNAKIDVDFHRYEDEDIDLDHDDYRRPIDLDSSQNLNIASSSEMNHVEDSIRDQILELKNNN
ncbi:uncharacterized protein LOC131660965 [Vicia villosa]|uniref:uncharacterized protein LOC131660965 n=1 Tax=Vicia villosa TaxID=3911 RepID=UPI00273AF908|nr:uncharacterized protein LOC131660965 [Vicia villosa]XP_058786325.1 uncharacterized protein LOC131660965 [Vicia villosa]